MKGKSSLSIEEEFRVMQLTMDGEEGDRLIDKLSLFGYTEEQSERMKKIDRDLKNLARSDFTRISQTLVEFANTPIGGEGDVHEFGSGGNGRPVDADGPSASTRIMHYVTDCIRKIH